MSIKQNTAAIFISFDAVAVSGITVEVLKIANVLKEKGCQIYLDLGYDIKMDKGNFNKPYDEEKQIYEDKLTLIRVNNIDRVPFYNTEFITYVHNVLISQTLSVSQEEEKQLFFAIEHASHILANNIVQLWQRLTVRYVFVENGTLPENIIYTKALYLAIDIYGRQFGLENFVVWRDHDLMWNSEKTTMKYGPPPYQYAIKPTKSNYITYVTLNNHLKTQLEKWCNHDVEIKVKKNTYDFSQSGRYTNIRANLNIGDNDILIARTTRIIPQKRLDRDIYLVHHLNQLFQQNNSERTVYLVIAGDTAEDETHYSQLCELAINMKVKPFIKFMGSLQHKSMSASHNAITIDDLYYSCDLVSFLTAWDYDSYGNPIGEAISHQRCYISTRYEYYQEVYGQHGFDAPTMAISKQQDGLPDSAFINDVFTLLNDKQQMDAIAQKNFCIGKRVLSNNVINILDF